MLKYNTGFLVESDTLVVGDPMAGGDYMELEKTLKGEWRSIAFFRGGVISNYVVKPYNDEYRVHEVEDIYIDNRSGYLGVFDIGNYLNDGSNEEYEEIVREKCSDPQSLNGNIVGGVVVKPNNYDSDVVSVSVGRTYTGEVAEVILNFS